MFITYWMKFVSKNLYYLLLLFIFSDMTSLLAELSPKDKQDECISFALKLRNSWAMANYCKFFKLYSQAPKMAGYLVDWFTERERKIAIKIIVKGYVFHGLLFCADIYI